MVSSASNHTYHCRKVSRCIEISQLEFALKRVSRKQLLLFGLKAESKVLPDSLFTNGMTKQIIHPTMDGPWVSELALASNI